MTRSSLILRPLNYSNHAFFIVVYLANSVVKIWFSNECKIIKWKNQMKYLYSNAIKMQLDILFVVINEFSHEWFYN